MVSRERINELQKDISQNIPLVHHHTALAFVLHFLHSLMPDQTSTLVTAMKQNPSYLLKWYNYMSCRGNNSTYHKDIHNSFIALFPQPKTIRIDDNGDDTDDECSSPYTLPNVNHTATATTVATDADTADTHADTADTHADTAVTHADADDAAATIFLMTQ